MGSRGLRVYGLRGGPAASLVASPLVLCACAVGPPVPAHVSATRGHVSRRACEVLLPGQRRRRASRRRTSLFASFACELLRERCWAAAAASAGVNETRAYSYLASLLHAMQKRLHASYEAGACRVSLKLAQAARQQRGRSSIQWRISLLGLDAARCLKLCLLAELRDGSTSFSEMPHASNNPIEYVSPDS